MAVRKASRGSRVKIRPATENFTGSVRGRMSELNFRRVQKNARGSGAAVKRVAENGKAVSAAWTRIWCVRPVSGSAHEPVFSFTF